MSPNKNQSLQLNKQNGIILPKLSITSDNVEPVLIDNDQASKIFNVTKQTLYNWRRFGKVKFRKIGGKIFYLLDELLNKTTIKNNFTGGNYEK